MDTFIVLLRGINVGGHNKLPMPELRSLCADLGWEDVQSYIQSGNLVVQAGAPAAGVESELERAIERRFGLSIPVIVRAGADWPAYVKGNPYPEASQKEPNLVMLVLSKAPPKEGAVEGLREHALSGERIDQVGDGLWIHYVGGVGRSKLSPALLDRLVGSPVTARNWRTVLKLNELAGHSILNDKQRILTTLREEFKRWEELLAGLSEEQITAPHLPSNLSIKDVVAHLWAWQQRSIARLEAALLDREPDFPRWPEAFDPEAFDVDEINAWLYETNREKPWSRVYGDWRAGFLRFLELGAAIPEKDLLEPGRYPWLEGEPLSIVFAGSYEHHHVDHLEPLLAWLRQQGNVKSAG